MNIHDRLRKGLSRTGRDLAAALAQGELLAQQYSSRQALTYDILQHTGKKQLKALGLRYIKQCGFDGPQHEHALAELAAKHLINDGATHIKQPSRPPPSRHEPQSNDILTSASSRKNSTPFFATGPESQSQRTVFRQLDNGVSPYSTHFRREDDSNI